MTASGAEEYQEVIDEAAGAGLNERERQRTEARLGAKLRRIQRRDIFAHLSETWQQPPCTP